MDFIGSLHHGRVDNNEPPCVTSLKEHLFNNGFGLASRIGPDKKAFGDLVEDLQRDQVWVRVLKDRSVWNILIGDSVKDFWYSPDEWKACLDGSVFRAFSRIEDDCAFVRERLPEIAAALIAEPEPATLACLERTRREEAARWLREMAARYKSR